MPDFIPKANTFADYRKLFGKDNTENQVKEQKKSNTIELKTELVKNILYDYVEVIKKDKLTLLEKSQLKQIFKKYIAFKTREKERDRLNILQQKNRYKRLYEELLKITKIR